MYILFDDKIALKYDETMDDEDILESTEARQLHNEIGTFESKLDAVAALATLDLPRIEYTEPYAEDHEKIMLVHVAQVLDEDTCRTIATKVSQW